MSSSTSWDAFLQKRKRKGQSEMAKFASYLHTNKSFWGGADSDDDYTPVPSRHLKVPYAPVHPVVVPKSTVAPSPAVVLSPKLISAHSPPPASSLDTSLDVLYTYGTRDEKLNPKEYLRHVEELKTREPENESLFNNDDGSDSDESILFHFSDSDGDTDDLVSSHLDLDAAGHISVNHGSIHDEMKEAETATGSAAEAAEFGSTEEIHVASKDDNATDTHDKVHESDEPSILGDRPSPEATSLSAEQENEYIHAAVLNYENKEARAQQRYNTITSYYELSPEEQNTRINQDNAIYAYLGLSDDERYDLPDDLHEEILKLMTQENVARQIKKLRASGEHHHLGKSTDIPLPMPSATSDHEDVQSSKAVATEHPATPIKHEPFAKKSDREMEEQVDTDGLDSLTTIQKMRYAKITQRRDAASQAFYNMPPAEKEEMQRKTFKMWKETKDNKVKFATHDDVREFDKHVPLPDEENATAKDEKALRRSERLNNAASNKVLADKAANLFEYEQVQVDLHRKDTSYKGLKARGKLIQVAFDYVEAKYKENPKQMIGNFSFSGKTVTPGPINIYTVYRRLRDNLTDITKALNEF